MARRSRSLVPVRPGHVSFFDTARRALTEAKTLKEVKDIVDLAVAAKEYARRASDREMMGDASDLQFDASVALGQKLPDVGLERRGRSSASDPPRLSLRDLGITKNFSSRCQRIARLPLEARDRMKKDLRDKATRRFATHEPGRALTVPTINVNQFANMIMSNLEDKIFKLVESRKMESLIGMRHELSSQASEMVDRKLTGLIEKLRSLRRRFSEGDVINVIEIPDRRSS